MNAPLPPQEEKGQASDTQAKTTALLRRLLVGNGYTLEDIKLEVVEEKDLHLPGRLALELQVVPTETRVPGLPKGNEAAVLNTREELAAFIADFHDKLASDTSWVDEIRARIAKSPTGGWGMAKGDWELGKQTKYAALVVHCDYCKGEKYETCKMCFGHKEIMCQQCNGSMAEWCPSCHGNGRNPSDPNAPCLQCRGQTKIPCRTCLARGRVICPQCKGSGRTQCIECQGHGYFTESTLLKVSAQGHFMLGSLSASPKGVSEIIEALGAETLARGHAVVTPVPSHPDAPPSIDFDALLPYGRYNMKIKSDVHDVIAVGMKPVLFQFPPLLDDTLAHVPEQLNAGTLVPMGRKYRLIRELAEAMGRGENPRRFFAQRYPFGLTAPLAMAIAGKLKQVFASASQLPRGMTAALAGAALIGGYYQWLSAPPLQLPLPPMAVDLGLAAAFSLLGWLLVALAGQVALKKVMPMRIKLVAAGSLMAFVTAGIILAACLALLYWPETRPAWLGIYLK